jgi:hypothetical protein
MLEKGLCPKCGSKIGYGFERDGQREVLDSDFHWCPECGYEAKVAVEKYHSRSKGEQDKGAIPETTLKSKGTLRGDEPYGDSPRAQLMDFSGVVDQ